MNKHIIALAGEMSRAFEGDKRNNGVEFRKLREGSPEWMTDIVHAAHGDMLPDDHRYEFIEQACDRIAELNEDASESDIIESRDGIEADIYTHDLLKWLSSRVDRSSYCDEAVEEFGGEPGTLVDQIMLGQQREKQEVFDQVLEALKARAEELEEEE